MYNETIIMAQNATRYTALIALETNEVFIPEHFSCTTETGVQQYSASHNLQPVTYLQGRGEISPDVLPVGDTISEQSALLELHTCEGEIERTMTLTNVFLSSQYPGKVTLIARLLSPHHD